MTTYPERAKLEKFLILNFVEIIDRIGNEKERILTIFKDIRKQLDANKIINNKVVACDDNDTCWIFKINKKEDSFYYLEFEGIAK